MRMRQMAIKMPIPDPRVMVKIPGPELFRPMPPLLLLTVLE